MAQPSGNSYIVGKGKVYFDLFAPGTKTGTGERYFGNTPSTSITSAKTTLDHYSSEGGIAIKDQSVDIQINRSGKVMTDNVDRANIALFFLGNHGQLVTTAATATVETIVVKRGLYYQLGRTVATPSGVRNVTNVTLKKAAATITATGNVEFDLTRGRIFIEPDAPDLQDGDSLVVTYDITASSREIVISKNQSIYGALRFLADNPVGKNIDYYMPYVKLSPEGEYQLKGDKWMEMSFALEVLKLDAQTESLYADGLPVSG